MANTDLGARCSHSNLRCVNPFEFIRKYRCDDCTAVMMCECDEEFGKQFLSHQLKSGSDLETRQRVPVTHGFVSRTCRECRGLAPEANPMAAIHGRTTKIRRYYWREIYFETTRRLAAWEDAGGPKDDMPAARKRIEKEVIAQIKADHEMAPKYDMTEPSDAEILAQYQIEIVNLSAAYGENCDGQAQVVDGGETCSVEGFVTRHYRRLGYDVMRLESVPFHVLFGVFTWLLIQDPADEQQSFASFGRAIMRDGQETSELVHTTLPRDFGAPGYSPRRARAIKRHFKDIVWEREELIWLFDYWLSGSENLRLYLHAQRDEDVSRARRLVEILPPEVIKKILEYLVASYWKRYLGWPDLLVFKEGEFLLVEVKSSSDRLSGNQKDWIAGNATHLSLPFKIAKVHRKSTQR